MVSCFYALDTQEQIEEEVKEAKKAALHLAPLDLMARQPGNLDLWGGGRKRKESCLAL